jgi:hypothetical protein
MKHNFGTEEEPNLIVAIGQDCDFEYIYSDSETKPEPPDTFEDPSWDQERNEQNKWFCRWKKVDGNYNLIGGVESIQNIDECNIQGYFPRLSELNRKIINENKLAAGIVNDLREKNTQLKVAETTLSAANEGVEEVSEDFLKLTGFYPWEISGKTVTKTLLCGKEGTSAVDWQRITDFTNFVKDTKDAAKEASGIYCADWNDLDLSKDVPGG